MKNCSFGTRLAAKIVLLTIILITVAALLVVGALLRPGWAVEIICDYPDGHSHTEDCYAAPFLFCGEEEHVHDDACFAAPVIECGEDEGHIHTSDCFDNDELICEEPEGHIHNEECIVEQPLICPMIAHVHDDECWSEPMLDCEAIALGVHIHDESCTAARQPIGFMPLSIIGGDLGNGVGWTFDESTGLLTITYDGTGSGEMPDNSWRQWQAFSAHIINIIIEDGVTDLSSEAFANSYSLVSIIIPESVTNIGNGALRNSTLRNIYIPDSVESIAELAFVGSSIESVTFGEDSQLYAIGDDAFNGCSELGEIELPANVNLIGSSAFENCINLRRVTFKENFSLELLQERPGRFGYTFEDGSGFYEANIGENAFRGCESLYEISIPATFVGIGPSAFRDCINLQKVTFMEDERLFDIDGPEYSNRIETIGDHAFRGSGLSEISIPASVITLGAYAFADCEKLRYIETVNYSSLFFWDGSVLNTYGRLRIIGDYAFENCLSLGGVSIPNRVESIGHGAFRNCEYLDVVSFHHFSSLQNIGDYAFENCMNLREIVFPSGLLTIGEGAFQSCISLSKIDYDMPNYHNLNVNGEILSGSIEPHSLETIGNFAFEDCVQLREVEIQPNVVSIGDGAFQNCQSLSSVKFTENFTGTRVSDNTPVDVYYPMKLSSIGANAFSGGPAPDLPMITANFGTYPIWWARLNGHQIEYLLGGNTLFGPARPGVIHKYVPYEFVPKTAIPNNDGLWFEISPPLPDGMELVNGLNTDPQGRLAGTIHGAPRDYDAHNSEIEYTMTMRLIGVPHDDFHMTGTFTLVYADTPDETKWSSNPGYEITEDPDNPGYGHIGTYNDQTGIYEITGDEQDVTDQILYIWGAPLGNFVGLWINGYEKTQGVDYEAEEGSTRVTILAQTIEDLENGEYTAAVAFRRADDRVDTYDAWTLDIPGANNFDVVAQKFTVNLANRGQPPGNGGDTDNGGNSGGGGTGGGSSSGGNPGGSNPGGGSSGGGSSSGGNPGGSNPGGGSSGGGSSSGGNPGGSNPGGGSSGGGNPGGGNPGGGSSGGDNSEGNNSGGGNPGSGNNPGAAAPESAAPEAPAPGTAAPETTAPETALPAAPAPGAAAPAAPAPAAPAPGTAAPPAPAPGAAAPVGPAAGGDVTEEDEVAPALAVGASLFSGLSAGPGGYYFELDGSGRPLKLLIDIAFEEYIGLYFNGDLWADGDDYDAHSGSTVITIGTERLELVGAGVHTISAEFSDETVEIVFTLHILESPPAASQEAENPEEGGEEPSAQSVTAHSETPAAQWIFALLSEHIMIIIIAAAGLLMVGGMLLFLRARRRAG